MLCCTVERLCLHCAVLRVAPSTHVAESKAQQCIRLWPAEPYNSANPYLSDHYYHPPDHYHHRGRRRLHPPPPAQPHTSSLATGSIATGDEERGGGVCVCVCMYVAYVSVSVRASVSQRATFTNSLFQGGTHHRVDVTQEPEKLVWWQSEQHDDVCVQVCVQSVRQVLPWLPQCHLNPLLSTEKIFFGSPLNDIQTSNGYHHHHGV